jgi:hypothetical protein
MIKPLSKEWWQARRGKITSSRMRTAIWGRPDGKNSLLNRLEAELQPDLVWPPEISTRALAWGKRHEPRCRSLIDFMFLSVDERIALYDPGLLFHREVPIIGATPDYAISYQDSPDIAPHVVGEIKCPMLLKHHDKLRAGLRHHRQYLAQVQTHLLVTGAPVAWFTSYHPLAGPSQRLYREVVIANSQLHDVMLERCSEMASMLQSGRRFPKRGVTKSMAGIPQVF